MQHAQAKVAIRQADYEYSSFLAGGQDYRGLVGRTIGMLRGQRHARTYAATSRVRCLLEAPPQGTS